MLRDYQLVAKERLRDSYISGKRAPLLVAPTGAGKTTIFCDIAFSAAANGKNTMIIAHRKELIDQASARLDVHSVNHGVIMADHWRHRPYERIQVASIDTLRHREHWRGWPHLIIIDEGHRAISESYLDFCRANPQARLLGVTATPFRSDGKGLDSLFDDIIVCETTKGLIEKGYLVPLRMFSPVNIDLSGIRKKHGDFDRVAVDSRVNQRVLIGNMIEHWHKYAEGRATMVYANSVGHSKNIAFEFNQAGIPAIHLDADSSRLEREEGIRDFKSGKYKILTNCGLFVEGTDIPEITCIILARPDMSIGPYLQMVGRGLRLFPGKLDCVVLDHANSFAMHGSPLIEYEYSLSGRIKKKSVKANAQRKIKACMKCFAINQLSESNCIACGVPFPVNSVIPKYLDGELAEILDLQYLEKFGVKKLIAKATSQLELEAIAKMMGYKSGWINHVMKVKARKGRLREVTRNW
jgi:superfamily II DNA or RNA helicase